MTREQQWSASLGVLAALALPLGAMAQQRLGTEFQVNTHTTSAQSFPSVAADADGDFVVAWDSAGQDGYGHGIFARLFSSAGAPLASEFQINTYTNSGQRLPSVAVEADGDFVVAWRSGAGAAYDIVGRRFSSAGAPLDSEFQVNTYTTSEQQNPAVATGNGGDFIVAWASDGQDGDGFGVFAQRFSSAGVAQASEFQVNTFTSGPQLNPAVAAGTGGDFVVAWQSTLQDGSSLGVFARRFSSAGAPLASEFQVNTYTTNYQGVPSVALSAGGDFVIVWQSQLQDGYGYGVFARRFSSAGAPRDSEFQVSAFTTGIEERPSVAADAAGDFVVAWNDNAGGLKDIFARRFSSAGAPLTTNFQVNTYTTNYQRFTSVAASAAGDFVVAWQSQLQDGDNYGVFAQRFAALATLDVDGNGSVQPLTDGLLVLRYHFGFSGVGLTSGAIGGACTRCDAATITPYLDGLGMVLDVDGNTTPGALTDGLLGLRYLFGFTGASLTAGAVGGGCSRCDATAIETYLAALTS